MKNLVGIFLVLFIILFSVSPSYAGLKAVSVNANTFSGVLSPANGGNPRVDVTSAPYNAKCDGSTDDTVALQAAITAINGMALTIPSNHTCVISSPLIFSGIQTSWSIDGGSAGAIIKSTATGVPIFEFATGGSTIDYQFAFRNLTLEYSASQSFGSNAIAIAFGDGGSTPTSYFEGEIANIRFVNVYRGISNYGSGGVYWGIFMHEISGANGMTGATIAYTSPAASGSLRLKLLNIYNSQTITEPQIYFNTPCYGCSAENIESNNGTNTIYEFGAWEGTASNLHIESNSCTANATYIINVPNSNIIIDGVTDNANFTVNPGMGNTCYLVGANPPDGFITATGVVASATITSGSIYGFEQGFAPDTGSARWSIKKYQLNFPAVNTSGALYVNGTLDEYEGTSDAATVNREVSMNPIAISTASINYNSDILNYKGAYWNGSGSSIDRWECQDVLGSGTNPTSTLTCSHPSGTSGAASINLSSGVQITALGIGTTPPVTSGTASGTISTWSSMVGIGTTSPTSALDVRSGSNIVLNALSSGASSAVMQFGESSVSAIGVFGINASGQTIINAGAGGQIIVFQNGSTEHARITSGGLVGIGTNAPQSTLSVSGGAAIGSTYAGANAASTNNLLVQGNIGIGTTTLLSTLTINGVTSYTGTAPTCGTGCSSITANSNNARGSMVSNSSVSAITLTFASSGAGVWSTTPFCTISDSNTAAVADISAISTSAMTVSLASALSAVTIYWNCQQ